ncbi:hypothetical protein QBC35DRAFT_467335, partial [Podospora australis]
MEIVASVAGISTAGAALSKAIYTILATIRDAPDEMADIASGITTLSLILDQLKSVMRKGNDLMINHDGVSIARLKWLFRRPRIRDLSARIECHKSTLTLLVQTMMLAVEQRKYTSDGKSIKKKRRSHDDDDSDDRGDVAKLRRQQAENAVQQTLTTLRDGYNQQNERENQHGMDGTEHSTNSQSTSASTSNAPTQSANEIQRWAAQSRDTATDLYYLVFSDSPTAGSQLSPPWGNVRKETQTMPLAENGELESGQQLVSRRPSEPSSNHWRLTSAHEVADRLDILLLGWTRLTEREVEKSRALGEGELGAEGGSSEL